MSADTGWKCKNCGNFNIRTHTCPNCGKEIGFVPEGNLANYDSLLKQSKTTNQNLPIRQNYTAPGIDLETKKCPFCAESIKIEAVICRYCGRDLPKNSVQPTFAQNITNLPAQKRKLPAWIIGFTWGAGISFALAIYGIIEKQQFMIEEILGNACVSFILYGLIATAITAGVRSRK